MNKFIFHSAESAPGKSRNLLGSIEAKMGFVPNLYAGLASSPATLEAYLQLSEQLAKTSFSPAEQQVLALTVSVTNGCEFCVAAHSSIARNMVKLDGRIVDALRDGTKLPDVRLEALSSFTRKIVNQRGLVDDSDVELFLQAGFSRAQVLEVILGVALKTLANYANHLLESPTNTQFAAESWHIDKAA